MFELCLEDLEFPPAVRRATLSTSNFCNVEASLHSAYYEIQWNFSHWLVCSTIVGGKRRNWNISHVFIDIYKGKEWSWEALVRPFHHDNSHRIRDGGALVAIQFRPIVLKMRKLN